MFKIIPLHMNKELVHKFNPMIKGSAHILSYKSDYKPDCIIVCKFNR